MFGFIKKTLSKIYNQVTSKIGTLFNSASINEETIKELEKILINADAGHSTTKKITNHLQAAYKNGQIQKGSDLKDALAAQLKEQLISKPYSPDAEIYLLVGINGSGKTTFASKLGNLLKQQNKKVLFVAGDTFRAAATEQLNESSKRLDIPVIIGKENQDPASVVYAGCQTYLEGNYDSLIIDTAGRLQTKVNLMKELEKIKKTIEKLLPNKKVSTLLTIDSMLGQNSFDQAKIFNECTKVDGIILTKMDGTAKGGIVFSISQELNIPVAYLSFGEQPNDLKPFNAHEYIKELLES